MKESPSLPSREEEEGGKGNREELLREGEGEEKEKATENASSKTKGKKKEGGCCTVM